MSVFIKKIQLLITDTYNVLPKVTYIEFDPTDLKMLDTDFFVCYYLPIIFFVILNEP